MRLTIELGLLLGLGILASTNLRWKASSLAVTALMLLCPIFLFMENFQKEAYIILLVSILILFGIFTFSLLREKETSPVESGSRKYWIIWSFVLGFSLMILLNCYHTESETRHIIREYGEGDGLILIITVLTIFVTIVGLTSKDAACD